MLDEFDITPRPVDVDDVDAVNSGVAPLFKLIGNLLRSSHDAVLAREHLGEVTHDRFAIRDLRANDLDQALNSLSFNGANRVILLVPPKIDPERSGEVGKLRVPVDDFVQFSRFASCFFFGGSNYKT